MSNRILISIGIAAGLFMVLLIGLAIGAGILYFLTQSPNPVFAAQENNHDPNAGLIVVSVDPGSPAEDAGIERGDILLEIDNQEVNSLAEVVEVLGEFLEGDEVQLTVLHGDDVLSFDLTMETDYYPGALGFRLCCGIDELLGNVQFLSSDQKPMIVELLPDSPAEDADLKVGDIILSINGKEIGPDEDLANLISEFEVGDEILLEILSRDSRETREVEVTLGEHPEQTGRPFLGVRYTLDYRSRIILSDGLLPLRDLDEFEFDFEAPPFQRHFEFPFLDNDKFEFHFPPYYRDLVPYFFGDDVSSGILVQEVIEESPAADAGLQPGDLITGVDGETIPTFESFREAIAEKNPGETVLLTIFRQDDELEFVVVLGEHPDQASAGYLGIWIGGVIHFGGEGFEHLPDDFQRNFPFDGFPFVPQPEILEPETEDQST